VNADDLRGALARIGRAPIAIALGAVALLALLAFGIALAGRSGPAPVATTDIAVAVPVEATSGELVSVTALEPVWIKIYEPEGEALFMGELAAGQSYELPGDVSKPMLWTGRPHAVEVRLGDTLLPVLGPPGKPLKDISLDRAALAARIPPLPPLPPVRG
jgi:cytoskeleton protein RodZ